MTKWVTKKLGDDSVAKIIMGQSPSSASYNEEFEGLPFLQGCAEFGKINPNTHIYCNEPLKVAPENSILMSVRAPVGTMNRADQKYIIGRGLCAIVPVIDVDYLYYYLSQNTHLLEQRAQGSTFLAVNTTEVSDMPITYPESLTEQRRIAGILSSADGAIAASEALIEKYRNIKRGLLATLLQPKEGWKKVKISDIGEVVSGGTPATNVETYWNGDVLFVTPLDLGREKVIVKTIRNITELGLANSSANKIKANSLAMSTRAPIGLMSIVKSDFCTNQGCKSIQFYDGQDSEFHYYNLSYNVEKIKRYGQGTTFMEISKTDFSALEFLIPNLTEQRRIAEILSSVDAKIAAEEKVVEKYKGVKKGLMEELLKSEK